MAENCINGQKVQGYSIAGEIVNGMAYDGNVVYAREVDFGLKANCVACWEASTGDLVDLTGNGHTAVNQGGAVYDSDKAAIYFNGQENSMYKVASTDMLHMHNGDGSNISFTMELIAARKIAQPAYVFTKKGRYHEYGFFWYDNLYGFWGKDESNKSVYGYVHGSTLPSQDFHHIVYTRNAEEPFLKQYINGVETDMQYINFDIPSLMHNDGTLNIGTNTQGFKHFNGWFKQLAIWKNRALTAEEVAALYNAGNPLKYQEF